MIFYGHHLIMVLASGDMVTVSPQEQSDMIDAEVHR